MSEPDGLTHAILHRRSEMEKRALLAELTPAIEALG